jgi:two-component system response regulator YesN
MNDHKMQELFKVETGCTIYRFHFIERMKEACRLLLETDEPLKNIAGMVGYKNTTSLINAFKDVYGVTPDEYRKDPDNHAVCNAGVVAVAMENSLREPLY